MAFFDAIASSYSIGDLCLELIFFGFAEFLRRNGGSFSTVLLSEN